MARSINLFYSEPDPDRWVLWDRYPRRILRRIIRGRRRPGGQERVFLNLVHGLKRLGMLHRINDYRYIRRHPEEVACVVGKAHVLDTFDWHNPIIFGSSVFAHPLADPDLLTRKPVKRILVPGEWMRRMFEPYYGSAVVAWPVGIDTDLWKPREERTEVLDFLIYNKIHWDYERQSSAILEPIRGALASRNLTFTEIQYGNYQEAEYHRLLQRVRGIITLGEHEPHVIAYLQ